MQIAPKRAGLEQGRSERGGGDGEGRHGCAAVGQCIELRLPPPATLRLAIPGYGDEAPGRCEAPALLQLKGTFSTDSPYHIYIRANCGKKAGSTCRRGMGVGGACL